MLLIGEDGHPRDLEVEDGEVVAIIDTVTGDRLVPRLQPNAPRFVTFDADGHLIVKQ